MRSNPSDSLRKFHASLQYSNIPSSNSFTMLERSLRSLSHRGFTFLRPTYTSTPPRLILEQCRRWYSLHPEQNVEKLQELDSTQLQITRTSTPKQLTPPKDLVFGRTFTGKRFTRTINTSFGASNVLLNLKTRHRSQICFAARANGSHKTTCSPSNGLLPPVGTRLE